MGYTLIISEKPSAAKKIAQALAEGGVKETNDGGATYYRLNRGGKEIIIAPAVGHLFVLAEKKSNILWTYPVFEIDWVPVFQANKTNTWSKKYYQAIQGLVKGADEFISACDYDIEGSLVAYNIIKFICKADDGKRMKFSTLTNEDLVDAYENASPHLDFPQIEAGIARHNLDWFWGINVSRALTHALRSGGGYKTLSTGRVQGPTLNLLEKREEEISNFKPTPFWEIHLFGTAERQKIDAGEACVQLIEAIHEKQKFTDKNEADAVFAKCRGQVQLETSADVSSSAVASVERKKHSQAPPFPFDLTTLQRESYNNFGYSPKQTLDLAQSLYEQALISYPRTSSQKLPAKLGFKAILKNLSQQRQYADFCAKLLSGNLKPNEGPKEDQAHPSIYPTGQKPAVLTPQQTKLYDMIVKRFLAVFADPAVREVMNVIISVNGEKFLAQGVRTMEAGWIDFYKPYAKFKELQLPDMKVGDEIKVSKLDLQNKQTQPPSRYTQASILKKMENLSLGTKGTRAMILQTLYDRDYIKEKSVIVTELGHSVISALEKFCPEIIDVNLTKQFEEEMEQIQAGKLKNEKLITGAREELKKILTNFKKNEKSIGAELINGIRQILRDASVIGKCTCGNSLTIRTSKDKKRFVGCTGYPNCTQTFSLPQKGKITILSQRCPKCSLCILSIKVEKKRPWKLCIRDGFANTIKVEKKAEEEKPPEQQADSEDVEDEQ